MFIAVCVFLPDTLLKQSMADIVQSEGDPYEPTKVSLHSIRIVITVVMVVLMAYGFVIR